MRGPVATCGHWFHDGEHEVRFRFICRKDCPWFVSEHSDFNQCDWRDTEDPCCCGHWQAHVEALAFLERETRKKRRELEADL